MSNNLATTEGTTVETKHERIERLWQEAQTAIDATEHAAGVLGNLLIELRREYPDNQGFGEECKKRLHSGKSQQQLHRYRDVAEFVVHLEAFTPAGVNGINPENVIEFSSRELRKKDRSTGKYLAPPELLEEYARLAAGAAAVDGAAVRDLMQKHNYQPVKQHHNKRATDRVEGFDPTDDKNLLINLVAETQMAFEAVERRLYPGPSRVAQAMQTDEALAFLKSILPSGLAGAGGITEGRGDNYYIRTMENGVMFDQRKGGTMHGKTHAVPFKVTLKIELDYE